MRRSAGTTPQRRWQSQSITLSPPCPPESRFSKGLGGFTKHSRKATSYRPQPRSRLKALSAAFLSLERGRYVQASRSIKKTLHLVMCCRQASCESLKQERVRQMETTSQVIKVGEIEGALMERLMSTLDFLFGCHHSHLSRVFTIGGRSYRVCCDCGAKFKYSLASMCMERRLKTFDRATRSLVPELSD